LSVSVSSSVLIAPISWPFPQVLSWARPKPLAVAYH
jgi:hypothetical protein